MTRPAARPRREVPWPLALVLAALALLGAACGGDDAARGGVVLVVTTDLAVPKDLDQIAVRIDHADGSTSTTRFPAPGEGLRLPIYVRAADGKRAGQSVGVRVSGWRGGRLRIVREATSTVPANRSVLLPVELHWLCDGRVTPGASPDDLAQAASACGQALTCVQGECVPAAVSTDGLRSASQRQGTGVDPGTGPCFDVLGCFARASTVAVRAQDCSIERPAGGLGVNVAMVLPPASDGTCEEGRCLIPFDGFSEGGGWTEQGGRIVLPKVTCERLGSRLIAGLAVTTSCPSKTVSVPLCAVRPAARDAGAATDASIPTPDGGALGPPDAAAPDARAPDGSTRLDAAADRGPVPDASRPAPDASRPVVDARPDASTCEPRPSCPCPRPAEACNQVDDDCDGEVDEGCPLAESVTLTDGYAALRGFHAPCMGTFSDNCLSASSRYCATRTPGFAVSGYGPTTSGPAPGTYTVTCVNANLAKAVSGTIAQLTPYDARCAGANQAPSEPCVKAMHAYCRANGHAAGFGPVEHMLDTVVFVCVNRAQLLKRPVAALAAADAGCNHRSAAFSGPCLSAYHRLCREQGAESGFGPSAVDEATGEITFACLPR